MALALLSNARGLEGAVQWSGAIYVPDHRTHMLFAWGTWSGCRMLVQVSPNGRVWFPRPPLEEDTHVELVLPASLLLRVGIENPGSKTDLSAAYV